MRNSFQKWYKSPNVCFALDWLLKGTGDRHPYFLIRKSRSIGLLDRSSPNDCRLDRHFAQNRVRKLALNLPNDPERLSTLLLGLGELSARSHAKLSDIVINALLCRPTINWGKVLSVAFLREGRSSKTPQIDFLIFLRWISSSNLNINTLLNAQTYVTHGRHPIIGDHYGLNFLSRIALSIDGRAADRIIEQHPNDRRTAAIGRAAIEVALPICGKAYPKSLLKSRQSAICCIGAIVLIHAFETHEAPLSLSDLHKELVISGLSASDATWMASFRLKELIHKRYRLKQNIEDQRKRLSSIIIHLDAAQRGSAHFATEFQVVNQELISSETCLSATTDEINAAISHLARTWPKDGLHENQIEWLDNCFVDTPEYRYSLAKNIPDRENRHYLFNKNIDHFKIRFGLNPKDLNCENHSPSIDDEEFNKFSEWTAMSLASLYEGTPRQIGKKTAQLLSPIHKAASHILEQPFLTVRKPQRWDRIFASAAYAYRFAMLTAVIAPNVSADDTRLLLEQAIANSKALLCSKNQAHHISWLTLNLAIEAVYNMENLPDSEAIRKSWVLDEGLPNYIRAMALWSSPILVDKHETLASSLFLSAGDTPLNRSEYATTINKMLNLADIAIAASAQAERHDLKKRVEIYWKHLYESWSAVAPEWIDYASKLVIAIDSDGPERQWLLSNESLMNSCCAKLVDTLLKVNRFVTPEAEITARNRTRYRSSNRPIGR